MTSKVVIKTAGSQGTMAKKGDTSDQPLVVYRLPSEQGNWESEHRSQAQERPWSWLHRSTCPRMGWMEGGMDGWTPGSDKVVLTAESPNSNVREEVPHTTKRFSETRWEPYNSTQFRHC